ncbi:MAG: SUMF1/EgtB/PvdO family nonheme iron enzyme [Desulfobacterales bacterium]|nr:SUMF1/EgtB/PvdO family nonheme iron enzyme [Desulfobacterales bacterium]
MLKKRIIISSMLLIFFTAVPCLPITGGDIQVTCEPGVRIWLDEDFKGKTSIDENGLFIENIPPGKHKIKAAKSGYRIENRIVEVMRGKTVEVKISFTDTVMQVDDLTHKPSPKHGTLILRSAPLGAVIYLDGEKIGKADKKVSYIPVGKHRLKFVFKGKTLEGSYVLGASQTLKLKAHFKKNRIINEYDKQYTNSSGMKFVFIPPGTVKMGNSQKQKIRIRGFYMQTTETTQAQWAMIMGENPSSFSKCGKDCPVEKVSKADALLFIRRLNQHEGTGSYRLPTQAEWEYACRAGKNTKYCFGNNAGKIGKYAWYKKNSGKKTHVAGSKKPNEWGLFDMHGNVSEWCEDLFGGTDPVSRGGDYLDSPEYLSCFLQEVVPVGSSRSTIGFRLVKVP